jgi:hypothetical protein
MMKAQGLTALRTAAALEQGLITASKAATAQATGRDTEAEE